MNAEQLKRIRRATRPSVEGKLIALADACARLDLTCTADPLNPCFAARVEDVAGRHWGGGEACASCTVAAVLLAVQS